MTKKFDKTEYDQRLHGLLPARDVLADVVAHFANQTITAGSKVCCLEGFPEAEYDAPKTGDICTVNHVAAFGEVTALSLAGYIGLWAPNHFTLVESAADVSDDPYCTIEQLRSVCANWEQAFIREYEGHSQALLRIKELEAASGAREEQSNADAILNLKPGRFYMTAAGARWCCFLIDMSAPASQQAHCVQVATSRIAPFYIDGTYGSWKPALPDHTSEHTLVGEILEGR